MATATYSASHVDSATTFCFSDSHEIGADPRKMSTPEVLRHGVRALTERERLLPLSHLDAEVVGECAEIAHSKTSHHLALEAIDVLRTRAGDDQVVHIHADNELLLSPSPHVERMLGCALREPKLA